MNKMILGTTLFLYHTSSLKKRPDLQNFIESEDAISISKKYPESIVVLGGDGSMLWAISEFKHLEKPFLGINFGSKGHLMHTTDELDDLKVKTLPLLQIELRSESITKTFEAFNEVVIKSIGGRAIQVGYEIGDDQISNITGDGLIIATPAGSTGYSLAAGGSELDTKEKSFIITPLVPFDPLHASPITYSNVLDISVTCTNERSRPIGIFSDGDTILETSSPTHLRISKSLNYIMLY